MDRLAQPRAPPVPAHRAARPTAPGHCRPARRSVSQEGLAAILGRLVEAAQAVDEMADTGSREAEESAVQLLFPDLL